MKTLRALLHRIASSRSTVSLRTCLIGLVLLGTVPSSALVCYRVYLDAQQERQRLDADLARTASWLAQSVERELQSSIEALTMLAYAGSIQRNDVAQFELELTLLPQTRPTWSSAYLLDRDGRLLFDTADAYAHRPLSLADLPEFRRVVASGAPAVSNLVMAPGRPLPATAIQVPILVGGKLRYVLGAWIDTAAWQGLIEKTGPPGGGFTALIDSQSRPIARALAPENAAATRPSASVRPGALASANGPAIAPRDLAGPAYSVSRTVPAAGWRVNAGVPASSVAALRDRAFAGSLLAAAASLAAGLWLALFAARRITGPLRRLAENDLGDPPPAFAVREIAQLREALLAARVQDEVASARLQAKRDLLQSKAAEFETLFACSPIGLAFAQDPECRSVIHNATMDRLFGPPTSTDGVEVLDHGRPLAPAEQPLQRAAATGETVAGIELEIRAAGQPPRFVLASAAPLRNARGEPRGAISAVVDISERKLAEGRLLQADQRLRESQRLVDLAQEAGRAGFFHYAFENDRITWTPGFAKLVGLAADDLAGNFERFLSVVADEDRPHVKQTLRRLFVEREEKETLEFRIAAPGGAQHWISSRVMVNYAGDGRPQQMLGIALDTSEQKAAEHERAALVEREQAARLEAEGASRAKDEFLAMIGHELRNPLNAIASATEVLKHVEAGAEVAGNARNIIARQTRHLARLVDELLDVARVISGKIKLSRGPLDLAALVERTLSVQRATGVGRDHELRLALSEVWVEADSMRIEQIVNNLFANAIKYTPPGGEIEIKVGSEDEQAILQVRDTGAGIPENLLPHVFGLFVQGERTLDRRAGGLGVGLTLVQRLVDLHGGSVSVASSAAGTVFGVRLPAIARPATASAAPASPNAAGRRRVAVIEDNEDALNALRSLLELDGHSVWTATDGESGLASLLEVQPDVAVIDIGLPGLTGFEVAKRCRAAGYTGRMIALSGYGHGPDIEQALTAGFNAHVVKPVDPDELRRLLAQA